jgi:hypothetical protein
MGTCRGVAATLASVVLFGSLILSNFVLVSASQERLDISSATDLESALFARTSLAVASGALSVLDEVQTGLASTDFQCSAASSSLAHLVDSSTYHSDGGGLEVTEEPNTLDAGYAPDNLTSIAPFAGSLPGFLDFSVETTVIGASAGGFVSFQKTETHRLNIPIEFPSVPSYCVSEASKVAKTVASLGEGMCNSTALNSAMGTLSAQLSASSSLLGLSSSLSYVYATSPSCSVGFRLSVSQPNVTGPLGPFSWNLEQSGSVLP